MIDGQKTFVVCCGLHIQGWWKGWNWTWAVDDGYVMVCDKTGKYLFRGPPLRCFTFAFDYRKYKWGQGAYTIRNFLLEDDMLSGWTLVSY
jgi:hypothetical protein